MPVYEYECVNCGVFDEMVDMNNSSIPVLCPDCGTRAPRVISAPRLAALSSSQRSAHERNERSAHEPRRTRKHVCGSGCDHGAKPAPVGQQVGKRPWMLGH